MQWFAFDSLAEARHYIDDAIERAEPQDVKTLRNIKRNLKSIWDLKHGCLYYSAKGELDLRGLSEFMIIHNLPARDEAYEDVRYTL